MSQKTKSAKPAYLNPSLPVAKRVNDLISRMTVPEKVSQTLNASPGIKRLGIPRYEWWNECLHGVGRAGLATVFPQAIGLAATWNTDLMHRVASVISDEARAKHHEALRREQRERYQGLTYWSPNINIFRDPRWGRGQETYGEDPYLTTRLGVAFVKGLQGDDPRYHKLVATPKHYAAHSGPEKLRHGFDARVSERDLRMTYLPAFEACVKEAKAVSIMGAYNRTNGEACCASKTLLIDILRKEWGFDGYVVSDCGAIDDIFRHHKLVKNAKEAAALAVNNGCDLNCGRTFSRLVSSVKEGLISEKKLTRALTRLFTARFRLGMFDPPELVPYAKISIKVNDCPKHRKLALESARQSIVLLKNDGLLPLKKTAKSIAVIGPNANDLEVLLGNYNGIPSKYTTVLEGIKGKVGQKAQVLYAKGCKLRGDSREGFAEAVEIAKKADIAILVLGLHPRLEGEEGDAQDSDASGDRLHIDLPGVQEELLKAVHATGTPVVLVLMGGSAIAINWADAHLPAIIASWYPGEEGGVAVADVLFGDYNPAGRLPVTFYKSLEQLPPFEDYNMAGRTYRYFDGAPLYSFGYGLSYTQFKYGKLRLSSRALLPTESLKISAEVENVGKRAGDEVVQLYVSDIEASVPVPLRQLQGFQRIHLKPGEKKRVEFTLSPQQLALIDDRGRRALEAGLFRITLGGGQPGARGVSSLLTADFKVLKKRLLR